MGLSFLNSFSVCLLLAYRKATYFFFFFYCCAGWGYTVAFSNVLIMYQIYHTWIYPSTALFHPPPLIPGIVSTGIIFAFTYMCIHYLHCIYPPIPIYYKWLVFMKLFQTLSNGYKIFYYMFLDRNFFCSFVKRISKAFLSGVNYSAFEYS
jgi:hypothetical protein